MLAKRIIPCLDIKNGRVVKGVNFVGLQDAGDPVEVARRYNEEGADELVFLDITASNEERKSAVDVVRRVAREIFIPLCVGGGISSLDDIYALLSAGCDKVSLNSAALRNPKLIEQAAKRFGSQCVVVAIDAKKTDFIESSAANSSAAKIGAAKDSIESNLDSMSKARSIDSIESGGAKAQKWEVYTHGGRKNSGKDLLQWAREAYELGAGEILLTSMDADGTKAGYDLEQLKAVCSAVQIPIIASGGAGEMRHILEAFKSGVDAALAASIFHYREIEINALKKYLRQNGVSVRI